MKLKDSPDALFHHYILDNARRRREFKYVIGTLISLLILFIWAYYVHANPPVQNVGMPDIVFTFIISQTAYYFIYTWYIGAKVLDVQKDVREELMQKNI